MATRRASLISQCRKPMQLRIGISQPRPWPLPSNKLPDLRMRRTSSRFPADCLSSQSMVNSSAPSAFPVKPREMTAHALKLESRQLVSCREARNKNSATDVWFFVDQHPRRPKAISQHSEALREERLLHF